MPVNRPVRRSFQGPDENRRSKAIKELAKRPQWLEVSGGAGTGTDDHAILDNLDYANANHTGFVSTGTDQTITGAKTWQTVAGKTAITIDLNASATEPGFLVTKSSSTLLEIDEYGQLRIAVAAARTALTIDAASSQSANLLRIHSDSYDYVVVDPTGSVGINADPDAWLTIAPSAGIVSDQPVVDLHPDLWYDAQESYYDGYSEGQEVTSLNDKSGNGRHGILGPQGGMRIYWSHSNDGDRHPTAIPGSNSGRYFSGIGSSGYSITGGWIGIQNATIFVVGSATAGAGALPVFGTVHLEITPGNYNVGSFFSLGTTLSSSEVVAYPRNYGTHFGYKKLSNTAMPGVQNWKIHYWQFRPWSSTIDHFMDDVPYHLTETVTDAQVSAYSYMAQFFNFNESQTPDTYVYGSHWYAEVIVFLTPLNSSQIETVLTYLKTKYNYVGYQAPTGREAIHIYDTTKAELWFAATETERVGIGRTVADAPLAQLNVGSSVAGDLPVRVDLLETQTANATEWRKTITGNSTLRTYVDKDGYLYAWQGTTPTLVEPHAPVTLAGSLDYITLSGQQITRNAIDLATDTTGILGVSGGGTGVNASSASNGQLLIGNGSGFTLATLTQGTGISISNAAGSITITATSGAAPGAHNFLDGSVHNNTQAATTPALARGDLISAQGSTPLWTRLAINAPAATFRNYLGAANGDTEPGYKALFDATTPGTISAGASAAAGTAETAARIDHVHGAPSSWAPSAHNLLNGSSHGDTTSQASVLGKLIYGGPGSPSTWTTLDGNTDATKKILTQTGTGTVSAAPEWNTLSQAGIQPTLTTGNLSEVTSSVLTISGGTGAVIGSGATIRVQQASSGQSGYLSSADWSTFNSKLSSISLTSTGGTLTVTGSSPSYNADLNLGHKNQWTIGQQFDQGVIFSGANANTEGPEVPVAITTGSVKPTYTHGHAHLWNTDTNGAPLGAGNAAMNFSSAADRSYAAFNFTRTYYPNTGQFTNPDVRNAAVGSGWYADYTRHTSWWSHRPTESPTYADIEIAFLTNHGQLLLLSDFDGNGDPVYKDIGGNTITWPQTLVTQSTTETTLTLKGINSQTAAILSVVDELDNSLLEITPATGTADASVWVSGGITVDGFGSSGYSLRNTDLGTSTSQLALHSRSYATFGEPGFEFHKVYADGAYNPSPPPQGNYGAHTRWTITRSSIDYTLMELSREGNLYLIDTNLSGYSGRFVIYNLSGNRDYTFPDASGTIMLTANSANPSATIGLSATNGSATTYMRSDAAPALSQAITPTWTQAHTFSAKDVHNAGISLGTSGLIDSSVADAANAVSVLIKPSVALTAGTDRQLFEIQNSAGTSAVKVYSDGSWLFGGSASGSATGYYIGVIGAISQALGISFSPSSTTSTGTTILGKANTIAGGLFKTVGASGGQPTGYVIGGTFGAGQGTVGAGSTPTGLVGAMFRANDAAVANSGKTYAEWGGWRVTAPATTKNAGTVTSGYGGYIENWPSMSSGHAVTTLNGLYIEEQTRGSTNYGIFLANATAAYKAIAIRDTNAWIGSSAAATIDIGATNFKVQSTNLGFYNTAPAAQPTGDALVGLGTVGLISGPLLTYGSLYGDEISQSVTISSAGTYYEVGGSLSDGGSNGMTAQNSKELKCLTAGKYMVHWSMSVNVGNANQEVAGAVMVNSTRQTNSTNHTQVPTANKPYSISGTAVVALAVNDLLKLCVTNHTATNAVVVEHANLTAVRIAA
jgi:hypothetical protein